MPKCHGRPWQPPARPAPPRGMDPALSRMDRNPGAGQPPLPLPPDLVASPIWLALGPASAHRYQAVLRNFFAYNAAHGLPPWLPRDRIAHSRLVVAWLGALWHGQWGPRCRASTLRSRLCAVSWCHRAFRGFGIQLTSQDNLALKALEATEPIPRLAKHAATPDLLWAARASLDLRCASDRVLLGATVLAYFFLLRKSEYAGPRAKARTTA